ncbi:hypothetical protein [Robiginitalea myxolifaciens]|nr:hypothetical protein [Robiginitalea myxolifaciens]
MKKLFAMLLLIPVLAAGQEMQEYPLFTNIMLTPNPAHISQLEAGLKEHNEKFHKDGPTGARVYWIMNGVNSGKYVWTMGPHFWSTMDEMDMGPEHMNHWNSAVIAHTEGTAVTHSWRYNPQWSNFSRDFNVKYLNVFIIDMKRFENELFMSVLERVRKVYAEKYPDQIYGMYFNVMPGDDGMDFAWIDFIDSMKMMNQGDEFPGYFEEVHGEGTFPAFLEDVAKSTVKDHGEIWMYMEGISGLGAEVLAQDRQ